MNKRKVLAFTVAILLCGMSFLALPSAVPMASAHTETVTQHTSLEPSDYPTRTTANDPTNWYNGAPGRFFIDSSEEANIASYYTQHKIDTGKKVTLSADFTMFDYETKRSMIGIGLQKSTGNPSGSSDWLYLSWEVNQNSGKTNSFSIHTKKNSYNVSQAAPEAEYNTTVSMTFNLEPVDGKVRLSATLNGKPFTIGSAPAGAGDLIGQTYLDSDISGEYYVSIITYQRSWAYTDGITVTSEVPGQPETKTTVTLGSDSFTPQHGAMKIIPSDDPALYTFAHKAVNTGAYSPYKVSADEGFSYEADVSFLKGISWAGLILSRKPDSIDTNNSEGAVYILRWYINTGTIQFVSYNMDSDESLYATPVQLVNSVATALNDAHKLKLEYSDGVFTIWFDDEAYFTYEDPAFVGDWYLGLMANAVNAKFSDMAYTTVSDELVNVFNWEGFSIRVDAPHGLRAKYAISKEALAATLATDNYRIIEYGAILTQREAFDAAIGRENAIPTLTPDGDAMDGTVVAPIWKDGTYHGSIHTETEDEMIYTGVLIDINPQNLDKDYVFRAYCIVELEGGMQKVLYSDVNERSIYDVALQVLEDENNGLTEAQEDFIRENIIDIVENNAV